MLERTGRFADGYICSTSAMPNFSALWESISKSGSRSRPRSRKIEKAGLNYLAIADDADRAMRACEAFFERYYGKAPNNIESQMIVGPAAALRRAAGQEFSAGRQHGGPWIDHS